MLDQEDEGTRIGVWVALGVVFFVLVGVIGGLVLRHMNHKSAAMAQPLAAAEVLIDAPLSGELLGKLYFESGSAALPADAASAVAAGVQALAAAPAKKLVLSGFHDATGDANMNAELAKQRALATRQALVGGGADIKRVLLRKPESTTGDGSLQEARRVEMRLVE